MIKNARIVGVGVQPDDYHRQEAGRGTPDFSMSPSSLKEFGRCPERWLLGYNPPGSDAKAWGNLLDTRLLTPQFFNRRFAIQPETYTSKVLKCPTCGSITDSATCRKCKVDRVFTDEVREWSNNSSECREWRDAQVKSGKTVISQKELADCDASIARLKADETIANFLASSDTQVLVCAEWHDDSGVVVPIRCLIDLAPRKDSEFCKSLGDLKTSRTAAVIPFSRQIYDMGYHIQAAFDLDLYVAATGEDRTDWCFVVQESYAPWQTGKRLMSQDFIELGRVEYKRLLSLYAQCIKAGKWPGYDDNDEACQGWTLCQPDPWMEQRAMFAPRFETEKPESAPEEDRIDFMN